MLWRLFSLFLFTSLNSVVAVVIPGPLTTCLEQSPDLTILLPNSSAFANASLAFNQRLAYTPAAIVYPRTSDAVSRAVKCAIKSHIPISARSGGHSYAAYGLGGSNGFLIVDLSNLKNITVDSQTGNAVVQTGSNLGDLALSIYAQGNRSLPHGTCPYVGVGGHASFGGYGPYSRKAGLLLDHITAAEVVLADGSIVHTSTESYPDLFWALRGAAPSYGIVTAWTFATLPAPPSIVNYRIDFPTLSESEITSIFVATQAWAFKPGTDTLSVPDEFSMTITQVPDIDTNESIILWFGGSFFGSESAFNTTARGLLDVLPDSANLTTKTFSNWIEALEDRDGSLDTSTPEVGSSAFFAKSYLSPVQLSNESWANWVHYLHTTGLHSDLLGWFTETNLLGGAISRVKRDDTAYFNRDAKLLFQLYGIANPPFPSDGVSIVDDMLSSLDPSPKQAYPNYVDPTLTTKQWRSQYFGTHYPRLSAIRKRYNPHSVFAFPQSIV